MSMPSQPDQVQTPPAPLPQRRRAGPGRLAAIAVGVAVVAGLVGFGGSEVLDGPGSRDGLASAAAADSKPGGTDPALAAGTAAGPAVEGEKSWDARKLTRNHVTHEVHYPMTPPVGGDHNPTWMNCDGDVYKTPLADVNAVHSLEHGAVWITYNADASAGAVRKLAARVRATSYTLLSPYPGQSGAIMLSAWGKQLTVEGPDDERVGRFLAAYVQGPQTPEPGAPCTGGLAAPR
ncbi:DUF3105 domain-containing protein [Streptomyces sp. NBC_00102]|uniref:DUF3105 domain-containing protein n=1 Tax=Streptomyces sp. NBC_00102 TaxID=2975652 RepID=UPI0022564032|nr:DUF3105 domain-containing protein [Streptomyces sp. NBC_00102]MCX5396632.1 DUF3105 domain-containing protein [Streptomyces sp. NBC_00102]